MGIIRMVKESDYDFIYNSIEEYKVALCYGYTKYIMKPIIENKYSMTLVYEEDGKPLAFYSDMTHPKSFLNEFYKNMPFLTKMKYLVSNQVNKYNSTSDKSINIPKEHKILMDEMYEKDSNAAVGLFAYSIAKEMILNHLAIYTYRIIGDEYKWKIGMLKKGNRTSEIAHRMLYRGNMIMYDADSESYFCVTDLEEMRNSSKDFKTKHILNI